jgi:penicillin-binding protein 2
MPEQSKSSIYQHRILIVMAVIGSVFLVLFGRLWYIQITRGDYFRDQAERNRLRIINIPAPRGLILDRKGRVLVDNEISFSLILRREYMEDKGRLLDVIERHLGLERADLEKKLEDFRLVPTVFPIPLKNRLDFAEIAFVEAHRDRFPELSLEWIPTRRYVLGPMASHIFGYVGEVTPEELAQPAFRSLAPGDIVGKAGLERFYNARVKGTKGQEKVFINSIGQITRVVEKIPAQKGRDLPISIDLEIQKKAEEMMEGQKGAVVAIDPRTGEVLCMVSKPEFDPNLFIGHLSRQQWQELVDNPDKPLQNKVIQGTFAPGSIFKILVAAAALGEKLIDPETTFFCPGQTEMLGRIVHCWNASGHGSVQLMEAITNSCNIYFYNVGLKVGVDRIHNWAVRMGLGTRSGIDLPGERAGLVPSSEWKQKTYGQPWYQGETVSVAIGQGAVNVTPLQVACFMCAISTDAAPPVPRFLLEQGPPPARPARVPLLPAEVSDLVVTGMQNVVESGTGTRARLEGIPIAGKTGTAQLINTQTAERLQDYQKEFRENSWFACFAPVGDPRIAIAVIVEHGGHGGTTAAPVAAEIMRKYFELYPLPGITVPPAPAPLPAPTEPSGENHGE